MNKINKSKSVSIVAIFSALAFVATRFLQVPILQTGGYLNFGEAVIYLAAIIFGPIVGGLVGAIGPALADLSSPYAAFAPFTFVIKGLEGLLVGKIAENKENTAARITAIVVGGIIMICGYYIVEVFVFMIPPAVAFVEVPFNIIQMSVGGFVAILLAKKIKNMNF